MDIDAVRLHFDPAAMLLLNGVLAVVMFGVALDLVPEDFRRVLRTPRAALVGLSCQFLLMPALASGLLWLLDPHPSIALGIVLVAACPGGNVSNFFTSLAGGNAALSISMSAVSTMAAIVMTPLNFWIWGSVLPVTRPLMAQIAIGPADVLSTVLAILVVPTLLGMCVRHRWPALARRLAPGMRRLSILVLLGFVAGALQANFEHFVAYIGTAFWIVLLVNGAALGLGYTLARAWGLPEADARAVCFETGIQNSGFGLILCLNFFPALGGMAIIAAWWGVWHLVSGMALALWWSRRAPAAASLPSGVRSEG